MEQRDLNNPSKNLEVINFKDENRTKNIYILCVTGYTENGNIK